MKQYPSIHHFKNQNIPIYAFDKLDGSNIRVEWSKKNNFYKYGSRKRLIDENDTHLGEAVSLVNEWERELSDIFKKERFEKVTCFFEYYGKNSFAGQHEDEEHKVTLIDVDIFKKGITHPKDFLKLYGDLDIAELLYIGNSNQEFYKLVKGSELDGMSFEGVVCKGAERKKQFSKPVNFKIKSVAWINKLKNFCKQDEKLFENLY